jgi:hypothetical protein
MSAVSFTRWRVRAVALAVLASAIASACNPTTPLTQGPRLAKDQTLRVLLDDQPPTLDPGQTQYPYETAVLRTISEPLLKPKADLSGVTPAAAETYEVSSNGTVYTFHLRKTAEYWDGTQVKAQDFVYAWQRLIDPRLAAPNGPFFAGAILNGEQVSGLDPQRDASQIPTALGTLGGPSRDGGGNQKVGVPGSGATGTPRPDKPTTDTASPKPSASPNAAAPTKTPTPLKSDPPKNDNTVKDHQPPSPSPHPSGGHGTSGLDQTLQDHQ